MSAKSAKVDVGLERGRIAYEAGFPRMNRREVRQAMNNAPVVAGAAIGSALMAASGVFSAEGLAVAGAAVIFVVAAFKFISNQNRRRMRPSSSPTEVHEPVEPPHAVVGSR